MEVWVPDESKNRLKLEPKAKKVVFIRIMEGLKVIRYWDKDARIIKVSRNFTFSENGELKELQVTKVPSLGAEGESMTNTAPQTISKDIEITPEPKKQTIPDTST